MKLNADSANVQEELLLYLTRLQFKRIGTTQLQHVMDIELALIEKEDVNDFYLGTWWEKSSLLMINNELKLGN